MSWKSKKIHQSHGPDERVEIHATQSHVGMVILELERKGVRKLNGHSASLSDELKARKEVAEVSILDCLFCLNIHS